jgi:hypothetical protein
MYVFFNNDFLNFIYLSNPRSLTVRYDMYGELVSSIISRLENNLLENHARLVLFLFLFYCESLTHTSEILSSKPYRLKY